MAVALAVAREVEREHAVAVTGEHAGVRGDAGAAAAGAVDQQRGTPLREGIHQAASSRPPPAGMRTSSCATPSVRSWIGQRGAWVTSAVPPIGSSRIRPATAPPAHTSARRPHSERRGPRGAAAATTADASSASPPAMKSRPVMS